MLGEREAAKDAVQELALKGWPPPQPDPA